MKKDLREKMKRFLTSEVGRTGVRAPLVLGVAGSTFLLSQMLYPPAADAALECKSNDDCTSGQVCKYWCSEHSESNCVHWRSECIDPES